MAVFNVNGVEFSLENKLVERLDRVIKRATGKDEQDAVFINAGLEGSGKCQKAGSKVLMANGEWKNIEDIKEGDLILSPQHDGSSVYAKVTGLSSWYCKENYDVVQVNKVKKKLYNCSFNHLIPFSVRKNIRETINGKRVIKKTYRIIKNLEAREVYKMSSKTLQDSYMSFTSPAISKFANQINCQVEPYTLGVYLGDGSYSYKLKKNSKSKSFNSSIIISTSNKKLIKYISRQYPEVKSIKTPGRISLSNYFPRNGIFANQLINLGLRGKGSGEKFIPKEALLSDINYRKKLLAGLIDTDGYYSRGGYQFTQKSKRLIQDIRDLVYSLGGRCGEIRRVVKGIKSTGFKGTYYSLAIYLKDMKLPLIKKYKIKKDSSFYLASNRTAIKVIPSTPDKVYGFSIDSPSKWYITDNWMVTHNTNNSICEVAYLKLQTNRPINLFFKTSKCVEFAKRTKEQIIILDEPAFETLASDHSTNISKDLFRLTTTMREKRHIVIINMTKFWKFPEPLTVDRSLFMIFSFTATHVSKKTGNVTYVPGRFFHIPKNNLESLWNDYQKFKVKNYEKYSTFGGNFPYRMPELIEALDITIEGKPHATHADYKQLRDLAVSTIGEAKLKKSEINAVEKERKLKQDMYRFIKDNNFSVQKAAAYFGINVRTLRSWGNPTKIEPFSLEKPVFEGGGETELGISLVNHSENSETKLEQPPIDQKELNEPNNNDLEAEWPTK